MLKFLGNTNNIIDWQAVVDSLQDTPPGYVGPRHSKDDDIIGIKEMAKLWDDAGFKLIKDGGTAGWDMFFPGEHFELDIVDRFSNFVNANCVNCWISRVNPGYMTPWHWDCNDNEDEWRKIPNLLRVTCNISRPQPGHAIMVEDFVVYNAEQGNVYQWPDRTNWHGGINCGFSPKYLLNYIGIAK